jgi:hypothetical protein
MASPREGALGRREVHRRRTNLGPWNRASSRFTQGMSSPRGL